MQLENPNIFQWTKIYQELANKLLDYKDDRKTLLSIIQKIFQEIDMKYPFNYNGKNLEDICPFTIFGCFNKGIKDENRIKILSLMKEEFGLYSEVPNSFEGVPVLNNLRSWFFGDLHKNRKDDIPNLWKMFEAAIKFADDNRIETQEIFKQIYETVKSQPVIKWNLSMGLYWIRPYSYLNLDNRNRTFLKSNDMNREISDFDFKNMSDLSIPTVDMYLKMIYACKKFFDSNDIIKNFPELSYNAWKSTSKPTILPPPVDKDVHETKYWIYTPGEYSSKWEEFYTNGIMGIEWDELGNLKNYSSRESMRARMKELWDTNRTYMNHSLATWQFANDMQVGNIVYAKKGSQKLVGRGIVDSDYIFDDSRDEYKNIRKIRWTHKGEWDHPGQAVVKTLTDITQYTDYVQRLEALFIDEEDIIDSPDEIEVRYVEYSKEDFLDEVFMSEQQYNTLVGLIKNKMNIILQGAPGVGKTFAAKRLAYSIMGVKDTSRVSVIQFHQSYSYEDFIMGYRPTKEGFELTPGPFYKFCKKAQDDMEREYFFIIDEINRGNLNKIFGELLMLIEKDKREEKLRLLYSNEYFTVPKNVYIIGMMNTADRSLAMIDYALRRRFAFFEMEPAFEAEGFKAIIDTTDNKKFFLLVEQVRLLNEEISNDESLGSGFRIGHSYLCPDTDITDEWIETVIKYELIPLLSEYWFDEYSKVQVWSKRLFGVLND